MAVEICHPRGHAALAYLFIMTGIHLSPPKNEERVDSVRPDPCTRQTDDVGGRESQASKFKKFEPGLADTKIYVVVLF
jgi:hypothetical protein